MHRLLIDATTFAADDAWADPAWQVNSTTQPCCGAIGERHTPNCQASWRDYADQLEAHQIAQLTLDEEEFSREYALATAQGYAADKLLQDRYDDVPEPAGATSVTPWDEDPRGAISRGFSGTSRIITPTMTVGIMGEQGSDGTVIDRRAYIDITSAGFDPGALDVTGLQRLAAACTEATDEINRLSAPTRKAS